MAFWLFIVVVALYAAAAGYTDFAMQRIPNYLTVPAAIGGFVCSLLPLPGYPTPPLDCLLGFAVGFAIFFIPFFFGGGGPGDLKLVAALGAWLGLWHLLMALMIGLVFAMVLMGVVWAFRLSAGGGKAKKMPSPPAPLPKGEGSMRPSPPAPLPKGEGRAARPKARRRRAVPFAIPMALGTWCILGGMIVESLRK